MEKNPQVSALKKEYRFNKWFVVGVLVIAFILMINTFGSALPSTPPPVQVSAEEQAAKTISKQEAEKELKEFMDLSKTANLVISYEFSDKASVVYIDKAWYSQKVAFKKDVMTKIALLKEQITGYRRFEVRDGYSDEKVAEVTVFDVEVYK